MGAGQDSVTLLSWELFHVETVDPHNDLTLHRHEA
jgi:hypothetical protein